VANELPNGVSLDSQVARPNRFLDENRRLIYFAIESSMDLVDFLIAGKRD